MLDLICRIYPNKTPSDYLKIDNEYTRFALDGAMALKSYATHEDKEQIYLVSILNAIYSVCKSMGAKGIKKLQPKLILEHRGQQRDALMDITAGTKFINRLTKEKKEK